MRRVTFTGFRWAVRICGLAGLWLLGMSLAGWVVSRVTAQDVLQAQPQSSQRWDIDLRARDQVRLLYVRAVGYSEQDRNLDGLEAVMFPSVLSGRVEVCTEDGCLRLAHIRQQIQNTNRVAESVPWPLRLESTLR